MKKSLKDVLKLMCIIIILIFSIVLIKFAWAKYMSRVQGNATADIARFSFNVTENSSEDLTIDLAQTRKNEDTQSVDNTTVAPGTEGALEFVINANVSEVSLKYNIEIDISNIPQNLIFYYDEEMTNAIYNSNNSINIGGFFSQDTIDKTQTQHVYWKWPMETGLTQNEIDRNDLIDSNSIGALVTAGIHVTGEQVISNQAGSQYEITFDATDGALQGYGNAKKVTKVVNEEPLEVPVPIREGYRFVGWNVGGENLVKHKISEANMWGTSLIDTSVDGSIINTEEDTRTIFGYSDRKESFLFYYKKIEINPTHKYYYSIEVKSSITKENVVNVYWPSVKEPPLDNHKSGLACANVWKKISGISGEKWAQEYAEYSGEHQFRYDFNNKCINGTCTFKKPILIDLTEAYGAGNEPSVEWCDNNIIYGETQTVNIPQDSYGKIVYSAVWEKDS